MALSTSGYFTNGLTVLATAMAGTERVPADTGTAQGAAPQLAALAPAQLRGGVYEYSVPLTGFSIQIGNETSTYIINPAGTLATGTFTLPQVPYPGHVLEIISTQTQTALTVSAPSGYTIVGSVTALTAATAVRYRLVGTVWILTR